MNSATTNAFVTVSPGVYRLEAPLTFASVASLRDHGLQILDSSAEGLTLDLQAVPAVDSAGLALLIDWLAEAKSNSRSLKYTQPPPILLSLAQLSDVEKLIAG
jgi:phospholipid transport system transporter-binding protein